MSESSDSLPTATRREVLPLIQRYQDRFNDNDADGLAELYALDISFLNLAGRPFAGRRATRDQQAEGFRGPLSRISIALEVVATYDLGVDYVLAVIRQEIDDQNTADVVPPAATVTMILDHTSGTWLIRHLQSTSILEPWTTPTGDVNA